MSEEKDLITGIEEVEGAVVSTEVVTNVSPTDNLLSMAIQGGVDLETLERLIDLKNKEEDRRAKTEYDKQFAMMQSEFAPVQRTKQGDKAKYAPLDVLQKKYKDSISKHGFSYRWSEEAMESGELKVILTISGHGHSESNHKVLPVYTPDTGGSSGKAIMNPLQAEGTRSTYGERYTFIAGFGLIIEDQDDDGAGFDEGVKYASYIEIIDTTEDHKELYEKVAQFVKDLRAKGDNAGADIVKKYYVKRKEALG